MVPADKGTALEMLRVRTDASRTVVVGDDVTDEDAFARLTPRDVGIKVGAGLTHARFRMADTAAAAAVLAVLAVLAEERQAWLEGRTTTAG